MNCLGDRIAQDLENCYNYLSKAKMQGVDVTYLWEKYELEQFNK